MNGLGKTLLVGPEPAGAAVAQLLRQSGLVAEACEEAAGREALWSKLAANCVINPLTALQKIPNGGLLSPAFAPILRSLAAELVAARADASRPAEQQTDALVAQIREVAAATAGNTSSMRADAERGAATEWAHFLDSMAVLSGRGAQFPLLNFLGQLLQASESARPPN